MTIPSKVAAAFPCACREKIDGWIVVAPNESLPYWTGQGWCEDRARAFVFDTREIAHKNFPDDCWSRYRTERP